MKKIPIILSSMALMSGYASILTGAELTQAVAENNTNLAMRSLEVGTELGPYEQYYNFKLDFDFANNWLSVATEVPLHEGDRLSWVTVVYRDVDQGVTEDEADAKATTLSNIDPDWAVILQSQAVNPQSDLFALPLRQSLNLDTNPTDIVYYAAQFTNQMTGDTYWLRGKLDYRRCRHAVAFGEDDYGCYAVLNEDAHQIDYALFHNGGIEVPGEDDVVLTWEEEWTQYLENKVGTLNQRIAELEKRLTEVNSQLSSTRSELAEKEQILLEKDDLLLGKDAEISGLRAEVSGLRAEIERLQQGGTGSTTDELETENRELRVQVQKLTEELKVMQGNMTEQKKQFEVRQLELEQKLAAQEKEAQRQLAELTEKTRQQLADQEVEFVRRLQVREAELAKQFQTREAELKEQMKAREAELNEQVRAKQAEFDEQVRAREAELNEQVRAKQAEFDEQMRAREAELAQEAARMVSGSQSANCAQRQGQDLSQGQNQGSDQNQSQDLGQDNQGQNQDQVLDNVTTILGVDNGKIAESDEEKVEIPNLGEETTVNLNIWWILAGIVGLFGVALLWLKRAFRER